MYSKIFSILLALYNYTRCQHLSHVELLDQDKNDFGQNWDHDYLAL